MDYVLRLRKSTARNYRRMPEVSKASNLRVHLLTKRCYFRWTSQRKAFGKPLNSQAVIRSKLAGMIARAESVQNWLESITYQMNNMVCRCFISELDHCSYQHVILEL
jgi:hypothetical protein